MYLFSRGLVILIIAALYFLLGKWVPIAYPFHSIIGRMAGLCYMITAVLIIKSIFPMLIIILFVLGLLFTMIALFLGNPADRYK